jgi:hypothetical protein
MNYYAARRLRSETDTGATEGWHFTRMNDGHIQPVGYCAEHYPHATADEACECFRRYLLDLIVEETYSDWTGCEFLVDGQKCDTPTKRGLSSRPPLGHDYALCDEHRTAVNLDAMTGPVGQITASY